MKKFTFLLLILIPGLFARSQGKYLETVKVTDSIYVFKPKIDWTHGNGIAIIGNEGVFFIDTYLQSNYAREAISLLKKVTRLPVSYVTYTHYHSDHVMGSYEFKKAFPSCKFIMTDTAAIYFDKQIAADIPKDRQTFTGELKKVEKEIQEGKASNNGMTIKGSMIPFWNLMKQEAEEFIKDYKPNQAVYPDIVFADNGADLKFKWGNQTIQLIPTREKGHSRSDVFIWIPEKRIAITGDIVVAPTAYALFPNIPGMVRSIQKLIDMNPAIIIPGHGEVEYDLGYVRQLKGAYDAYIAETKKAIEKNEPYRDAIASIKLPAIDDQFIQGDDLKRWAYESFFRISLIKDIYKKFSSIPVN